MHGLYLRRLVWLATVLAMPLPLAAAGPQTVCTITVNSADEKEAFRRSLPEARYRFVELVERGRPDWLASACHAGIACDVLIISGHYDGGNAFFSDQLEVSEFLPVDEMERASCSESCPGLFSRLKEVHLFGCNTLNPEAQSSASAEAVRGLVREGHAPKQARRLLQSLNAGRGESSRDRMRLVFKDVPVIYGFSSVAPLGPVAATTLSRYFRSNGAREIGQGRASPRLLRQFAPFAMTVTQGMTDRDPQAAVRRDVCRFVDERLADTQRLAFIHQLLQRQTADAEIYLDRIQRYLATLGDPAQHSPEVAQALAQIAGDAPARARFLDAARATGGPAVRARMLKLAHDLGWLSDDAHEHELALMLGELQARSEVGLSEVDLACTLNREHELDGAFRRRVPPGPADDLAHAALRACLGSSEAQARMLQGWVSPNDADVQIAQAYLRHRPLADAAALRRVAAEIAGMDPSPAQVLALEILGRHYVSDREIVDLLIRLYAQTSSAPVQSAIAGILIRADRRAIASPQLLRGLRANRLPAPPGDTMIDALIRRLQSP